MRRFDLTAFLTASIALGALAACRSDRAAPAGPDAAPSSSASLRREIDARATEASTPSVERGPSAPAAVDGAASTPTVPAAPSNEDAAPARDAGAALEAVDREYREALDAFYKSLAKQPEGEQQAYYEKNQPDVAAFTVRVLAIADANRRTDVEARALAWIVENDPESTSSRTALERLVADHAASDSLAEVCGGLVYAQGEHIEPLLQRVIETSTAPRTRGVAQYTIAQREMRKAASARRRAAMPAAAQAVAAGATPAAPVDPDALERHAIALLESVARDYADVPMRKRTLGEVAEGDLFELRELAIGKIAPDIVGEDVDGAPIKLSDYRGKVVVLDFWGHW